MADDLDHLTLSEGYATLQQGQSTANATKITALITAASQRIDRAVGPVVRRTITAETNDGEGVFLQMAEWPVVTVTAVTEDGTALTTDQWYCDTEKGLLYRRDGDYDYPWCTGRDNIEYSYTAGRFASTATVDELHKQGTRLLLKHLWRAEQWSPIGVTGADFDVPQVAFPSFAVPKAVIDWFGPAWRESTRDPTEPRGGFV